MVKSAGGPERLASWEDFEASERDGPPPRPAVRSARARLLDAPPEAEGVEALTSGVDLVEELEAILRQGFVESAPEPAAAVMPAPAAPERAFVPSTAPVEEPLPAPVQVAPSPLPPFLDPAIRDAALVRPAVPPPGPVDEAAALLWEERPHAPRRGFRTDLAIAAVLLLGVLGASGFAFLRSTTPPAEAATDAAAETAIVADPPTAGDEVILLGGAAVPPLAGDAQSVPAGDSGAAEPLTAQPAADAAAQAAVAADEAIKVEDRVPADPNLAAPPAAAELPTFVTEVPLPAADAGTVPEPTAPAADPKAAATPPPAAEAPSVNPPAVGTPADAGVAEVTTWVNMRSGPDNGAAVVTVVPAGASVLVTGCDLWCEVMYEGRTGWIFQTFLRR